MTIPVIEEVLSSKGRVKLLVALAHHKELSITELAIILDLNPRHHIDAFLSYNIIKERKPNKDEKREYLRARFTKVIGDSRRIKRLYSLNEENLFVRAFLIFYNTIQNAIVNEIEESRKSKK